MDTPSSKTSFLARPEGKLGLALPVIAVALVVWLFGSAIGDFVVNAADNMLHLIIVGTAIMGLLFVLMDGNLRRVLFYLYRNFIKWLAKVLLIAKDPIGVRETYLAQYNDRLSKISGDIANLKGQKLSTERKAADNKRRVDDLYGQLAVVQAQKINDPSQLTLIAHKIDGLESLDRQYVDGLKNCTTLLTEAIKYQKLCVEKTQLLEFDIQTGREQMALSKSSRSLISGMRAIMQGMPGQDLDQMAAAEIDTQYTTALGEVDNFTSDMSGALIGTETADMASVNAVVAKLKARKAAELEASQPKPQIAAPAKVATVTPAPAPPPKAA